jgi:KipI family sensor histidine kinase inhibitor
MEWRALGDAAWLGAPGGVDAQVRLCRTLGLAARLRATRIPEVTDIVTSFDTLAVHSDPADGGRVIDWLRSHAPSAADALVPPDSACIEVPVDYHMADATAAALGLSKEELVRLHGSVDYTVAALGFSPGFPYLTGLPGRLVLPRLATPRKVAAGSVAIAGMQAGIYPCDSQGGWHVIGRTALRLFDPLRERPSLFAPGDRVRFVPATDAAVAEMPPPAHARAPVSDGVVEVIDPGPMTSVQDLGRPGYQESGVSPGGAADPVAAIVANRLVGNPDGAAVLECCMGGPRLKFHRGIRAAWVGWGGAHAGRPVDFHKNDVLDLRHGMSALRGCLAIAGGLDVPLMLGSRATDLRAGFGGWQGRTLRAGDRLPAGEPPSRGPAPGAWRVGWPHAPHPAETLVIRFLKGVQQSWFTDEALSMFGGSVYQISPVSDRTGARLDGPRLAYRHAEEPVSQPVAAGSVQVPPDGRPIILLAERQTIGGYPQVAHIISADLPLLARARPGTRLRFREADPGEARAAWQTLRRELGMLAAGIESLTAITDSSGNI